MPYVSDGAAKYSSHDVHSPLINPEQSCGQCHTDVEYVVGRVTAIQEQVFTTKEAAEDALIDAINAIKAAAANPEADQGPARPGAQPAPQGAVHVGLRLR